MSQPLTGVFERIVIDPCGPLRGWSQDHNMGKTTQMRDCQ